MQSTSPKPIEENHLEIILNGDGDSNDLWEEIVIPVPWGKVLGKWWGNRDKQPVLALHGWQDNAGTFDKLIPLLSKDISILAIDLPGHGKSSHYPKGMHYFLFWDGISLIRRIVRRYNWSNVELMGHSLGGALCFMYAACFPDEVNKLITIDIAGPTVRDSKRMAGMTGGAIDKYLDYENLSENKMPCYNYKDMIDLVIHAYGGSVDEEGVKILMKRGMAPVPNKNGYLFARDVRLKVSLMGMFTEEQVLSYAEQIKCKVLNIRAVPGMDFDRPDVYQKVIEILRKNAKLVIYREISGTHHIHLVNPERISNVVDTFLQS